MKIRPHIFLSAILFAILLLALLLYWHRSELRSEVQASEFTTTNGSASQIKTQRQPVVTLDNKGAPTSTNYPESSKGSQKQEEIFRQAVENMNSPIRFYGKIIDQNGNPISGVSVQIKVRQWHTDSPETSTYGAGMISIERVTGADGRFEITDVTGDGIQVESVQKSSYLLSPKAPNHFGSSIGNFEDPAIIKMWKEGIKEPLVTGNHIFGMDSDQIYTLDLLKGLKIKGEAAGDLHILISRPANVKPRDKFPWSFSIEGIGGGLIETNDEFMYFAPESGYESKFQMQLNPLDSGWVPTVKKQFYIRSRNEKVYGWIQIEVNAIYNGHSAFEINYLVNPRGSRNLQP